MVTKEEQKLIDGCIQGKSVCQKQLYLEYGPIVKGVCQRYAANEDEAEDLFHDTFVFILTHFKEYNHITSLPGWLYRIAVNKAVDYYRKRSRHNMQELDDETFATPGDVSPMAEVLSLEQLVSFINELPDRQRIVFNMFVIDGYSQEEIGKITGESNTNVRTLMFRAKATLRKRIRKYLNHEEFDI